MGTSSSTPCPVVEQGWDDERKIHIGENENEENEKKEKKERETEKKEKERFLWLIEETTLALTSLPPGANHDPLLSSSISSLLGVLSSTLRSGGCRYQNSPAFRGFSFFLTLFPSPQSCSSTSLGIRSNSRIQVFGFVCFRFYFNSFFFFFFFFSKGGKPYNWESYILTQR